MNKKSLVIIIAVVAVMAIIIYLLYKHFMTTHTTTTSATSPTTSPTITSIPPSGQIYYVWNTCTQQLTFIIPNYYANGSTLQMKLSQGQSFAVVIYNINQLNSAYYETSSGQQIPITYYGGVIVPSSCPS